MILPTHLEVFDVPTGQRTGRVPFDLAALASLEDARPVSPLLGGPALSSLDVRALRVYRGKPFALVRQITALL